MIVNMDPPQLRPHKTVISSFYFGSANFKAGKTVELTDGTFTRIRYVLQTSKTSEVFLRWPKFHCAAHLDGFIPTKVNELCWVEEVFLDGSGSMKIVALGKVLRMRHLRLASKLYNDCNFTTEPGTRKNFPSAEKNAVVAKREGILFCRTKHSVIYKGQAAKWRKNSDNFEEQCLLMLQPAEVNTGYEVDSAGAQRV